jgi:hypothetical protein
VIEINKNELSAKFEGVNVKALFNLLNFWKITVVILQQIKFF